MYCFPPRRVRPLPLKTAESLTSLSVLKKVIPRPGLASDLAEARARGSRTALLSPARHFQRRFRSRRASISVSRGRGRGRGGPARGRRGILAGGGGATRRAGGGAGRGGARQRCNNNDPSVGDDATIRPATRMRRLSRSAPLRASSPGRLPRPRRAGARPPRSARRGAGVRARSPVGGSPPLPRAAAATASPVGGSAQGVQTVEVFSSSQKI